MTGCGMFCWRAQAFQGHYSHYIAGHLQLVFDEGVDNLDKPARHLQASKLPEIFALCPIALYSMLYIAICETLWHSAYIVPWSNVLLCTL